MASVIKRRLGGLKKIHFAPMNEDGTYAEPVHIVGAKKVTAEMDYEEVKFASDDVIDFVEYIFNGGSGTLNLKSLLASEYKLLFGNTVNQGRVSVNSNDTAPNGALLFERKKLGSSAKRLYVIYNTKFSPASISAETQGDKTNEETEELKYSISQLENGAVFDFIDTDEEGVDETTISSWYTTVQTPKEASGASIVTDSKGNEVSVNKMNISKK